MKLYMQKQPLWLQIAVAVFVSMATVGIIFISVVLYIQKQSFTVQLDERSEISINFIAHTSLESVITEDIPILTSYVPQLQKSDPAIHYIKILNEDGKLLASFDLDDHLGHENDPVWKETLLVKTRDIILENEKFGSVEVAWNTSEVQHKLKRNLVQLLPALVVTLVLLTLLNGLAVHIFAVGPIGLVDKRLRSNLSRKPHPDDELPDYASVELQSLDRAVEQLEQHIHTREQAERELLDAKESAEAANRAKSEFMATLNHELRTPLTSSIGSLRLLNSLMLEEFSDKGRELLEIALRNNNVLLRLVNELLDYEKILSGTLEIETNRHNICELTSHVIKDNQGYARAQSVNFVFEDNLTPLYADVQEHRFEQVLKNLLSNAAKFSKPGSDVKISVSSKEQRVFVNVTDSGPGVPEEFRKKIYDKFTQADASSTRHYSGTGLGLTISKALTENMGGELSFDSEVGVGSTFYISFPQSDCSERLPS